MDIRALLGQVDRDLALYLEKIRRCVALLSDEQVWWRPNRRSNSVGNLVLHLCGNLSQWLLAGVGSRPYERKRSLEFSAERAATAAELIERLAAVVASCREVLAGSSEAELAAARTIQGRATDGLGAVLHAWEHMSYHTGQIVLLTKQQVGDDVEIEFYAQHRGE
jgi:uncharacterized damage-inducible protein DinB